MKPIDREQLHELYLAGKSMSEIAAIMGSTHGSIRTIVMAERRKYPYSWPYRRDNDDNIPSMPLMMHLYECTDCCVKFAVEDYEDIDHSATVCPICQCDSALQDAGYGQFVDSKKGH